MLIRLLKKDRPTTEIYLYCFSDYKTNINYFKKLKPSKYFSESQTEDKIPIYSLNQPYNSLSKNNSFPVLRSL
jgi:hypothetical protein